MRRWFVAKCRSSRSVSFFGHIGQMVVVVVTASCRSQTFPCWHNGIVRCFAIFRVAVYRLTCAEVVIILRCTSQSSVHDMLYLILECMSLRQQWRQRRRCHLVVLYGAVGFVCDGGFFIGTVELVVKLSISSEFGQFDSPIPNLLTFFVWSQR